MLKMGTENKKKRIGTNYFVRDISTLLDCKTAKQIAKGPNLRLLLEWSLADFYYITIE